MTRSLSIASAVILVAVATAMSWVPLSALALEPAVELGIGAGSVTHAAGEDGPLLPSITATVGFRNLRHRFGVVVGRLAHSFARGWMLEIGVAYSADLLAVELDESRTAGFYARLEVLLRVEPWDEDAPDPAFPTLLAAGIRALGLSIQVGLGPVWEPGIEQRQWGWVFETRLSVDFFDDFTELLSL